MDRRVNSVPLRAVVCSCVTYAHTPAHVRSWWHRAPTSLVPAMHKGERNKFVAALRAPTCGFLHYLLSEQSICTCHIVLSLSRVLACSFSLALNLDSSHARSLSFSLTCSFSLSLSLSLFLSLSHTHTQMLGTIT